MIWIEVLGPSGVGKSYWYAHFMKLYPELQPEKLLLKRVYEKRKKLHLPIKMKLFFFFYHLNLPKVSSFFKNILVEYCIQSYPKSPDVYRKNNTIAEKYLQVVRLYQEPEISILSKIQYFAKTLNAFRAYEYYLESDDVFIAEDGLLHLSPTYFDELNPDIAIVLEKDKEIIIRQRKERAKSSPRLVEELFNEQELKNYLDNALQLYTNKINALKSRNIIRIIGEKNLELESTYQKIQTYLNK